MHGLFKRTLGGLFVALVATLALSAPARAAAEPPVRILAMGDSLTHGFGVRAGMDFPAQLERALKAKGLNVQLINGGVSGDTSAGGLARIDWSLSEAPDAVILEFGGNDALRGLSPAELEKNLDGMLVKIKAKGIPALVAGMKAPRNMGTGYVGQFDAVFERVAKKHGVLYYPFFLEVVALERALLQPELIHPNESGVSAIATRMTPIVTELVAQARARRAR
jgi:acyl-CoA thioesterase-1